MPISLRTKIVFHCKCIRCGYEWDADKKPMRCAGCKYRTWNGEDQRRTDPFIGVPVPSQIKIGTEAPRPPSYEAIAELLTKSRGIIGDVIEQNPCNHARNLCVCAEKELTGQIDQQIEKIRALRPLRSTYLVNREAEAS